MRRVSRRRGARDRGDVSTLPQQPAEVLIGPNSKLFGSKLHATKHKGPEESPGLFSCLKSAPGARATLNKSLARRASQLRAVCVVANPRHSCGYGCGLRLAFHPAAGRAPSREPIQRGQRARLPVLRGTNRGDCASGQGWRRQTACAKGWFDVGFRSPSCKLGRVAADSRVWHGFGSVAGCPAARTLMAVVASFPGKHLFRPRWVRR
jgi:hypothetical protein